MTYDRSCVSTILSKIVAAGQQSELSALKLAGISLLFNFCYEEDGLRSWKAYKMGPGKLFPWSELTNPSGIDLPFLTSTHVSPEKDQISFSAIKSKRKISQPSSNENIESMLSNLLEPDNDLFACPEEGCVKVYQRYLDLQYHLDCGKHDRMPEQETLLDKAVLNYASKIEQRVEPLPKLGNCPHVWFGNKVTYGLGFKDNIAQEALFSTSKELSIGSI